MYNLFSKKSIISVSGDSIISTSVKLVMLIVQHNTFFNIMDHLAPLIRNGFSDRRIAKQCTCCRTKTTAIVNCINDYIFENLKDNMLNFPFRLMLDGSNDIGLQKNFPVTVCIYEI